ncbi:MAG TPA: hypothetical protein VEO00_03835 [Actinomycetota bacterium]|nr:hypothetical protein [Actinomycetota bacterium]
MIVQPGVVYGPGDRSQTGGQFERAALGKLPFLSFPEVGFSLAHVDDVAEGILLAHDRGEIGHSYVFAGNVTRMREAIETIAAAGGTRPPRFAMPTWAMEASIPFGRIVGKVMGVPPNLREIVSASDGVTYWASSDRARRELGYRPRDMRDGLAELARDILGAHGRTPGAR